MIILWGERDFLIELVVKVASVAFNNFYVERCLREYVISEMCTL